MKKFSFVLAAVIVGATFLSVAHSSFANTVDPNERFNQATATWPLVSGAKCYNIYYKRTENPNWKHSVRCVANNMWKYTIGYLKKGHSYVYTVSALDNSGKEFSWTPVAPLVASPQN